MEALFQYIGDLVNFPIDQVRHIIIKYIYYSYYLQQVRYLVLFLLSFPLAFIFRLVLTPAKTPLYLRHGYSATIGIVFGFLCFSIWYVCNYICTVNNILFNILQGDDNSVEFCNDMLCNINYHSSLITSMVYIMYICVCVLTC